MAIADAAGGAGSAFERMLLRMAAQQRVDEEQRHNMATEAATMENLRQQNLVRQSLEQSRKAASDLAMQKVIDARNQQDEEDLTAEKYLHSADPMEKRMGAFLRMKRLAGTGAIPASIFGSTRGPANSQAKTVELTDPQLAQQFGKKVGDRIQADYFPDPDKPRLTYGGVDVSKGTRPYETPQQGSFGTMQSGEEQLIRDNHTGKVYRIAPDGSRTEVTGTIPLATDSATRTMMNGAKELLPHVKRTTDLATQLDQAGLFGPIMSRVRDAALKLGTVQGLESGDWQKESKALIDIGNAIKGDPQSAIDELAARFATSLGLMATAAGRVHGGARGGGSPLMLEHFKNLLTSSSTLPAFRGRMGELGNFLDTYARGPNAPELNQPQQNQDDPLGYFKPKIQ